MAVVFFTSHFRQYLLGHPFTVHTDHSSLGWLVHMKDPEGQLARWLEKLNEFDFCVEFWAGKLHGNADVLSRKPCWDACPCNCSPPSPPAGCERTDMSIQCQTVALDLTGAQDAAVLCNLVRPTSDDCSPLEEPHVSPLDSSGGGSDREEVPSQDEESLLFSYPDED